MRNYLKLKAVGISLILSLFSQDYYSQTHPDRIDFEPNSNGYAPVDIGNIPLNGSIFETMYGIQFQFVDGSNVYNAINAKVGPPTTGFVAGTQANLQYFSAQNCVDFPGDSDHPVNTPLDEGCWFLTDGNGVAGPPNTLQINYDISRITCRVTSGYIIDVDGNEAFLVKAYTNRNFVTPEAQLLLVSDEISPSIAATLPSNVSVFNPVSNPTHPLYTTGDARSAFWQINTSNPIERIEIEYVGDPTASVGLAFDEFSFCSSAQCGDIDQTASPYTTGFDQSNQVDLVIEPQDMACHSIDVFDDDLGDLISVSVMSLMPGATSSVSNNGSTSPTFNFCWYPGYDDLGIHYFDLLLTDCSGETKKVTFKVTVICPDCYTQLFYENRRAATTPLPNYSEAASLINAGNSVSPILPNGLVDITGTSGLVEFVSGKEVRLENGFSAKSTSESIFNARIEDVCTELSECKDCCSNWDGFTIDRPLSNTFTPNGDGINDVWAALDNDNVDCAYGALGYKLEVINRWNQTVYSITETSLESCCPFQARTDDPNNPPSIHWDGKTNGGVDVSDGTYFIILTLYGCNGSTFHLEEQDVFVSRGDARAREKGSNVGDDLNNNLRQQEEKLSIYPNPSKGEFNLQFEEAESGTIKIYDIHSRLIREEVLVKTGSILLNLSNEANGVYFIELNTPNGMQTKKIIVQH